MHTCCTSGGPHIRNRQGYVYNDKGGRCLSSSLRFWQAHVSCPTLPAYSCEGEVWAEFETVEIRLVLRFRLSLLEIGPQRCSAPERILGRAYLLPFCRVTGCAWLICLDWHVCLLGPVSSWLWQFYSSSCFRPSANTCHSIWRVSADLHTTLSSFLQDTASQLIKFLSSSVREAR
jgi:hypothetical protein